MKYTLFLGYNISDRFLEFNTSAPKYFSVEKVFKDFKSPYPFNLADLQLERYVGSKQNTVLPYHRINTIGVRSINVGYREGFVLENHIIPLIVIILIMILIIKH